jgi:hypothetical protein
MCLKLRSQPQDARKRQERKVDVMLNQCARPQLEERWTVYERISLTLRELFSYSVVTSLPKAVNVALELRLTLNIF